MSSPNGVTENGPGEPEVKFKVNKRSHRKLITFLLSCCVFLGVFSACLLAALVLIGKHYIHNYDPSFFKNQTTKLSDTYGESSVESNKTGPINTNFRLPKDVSPIAYDITFKPDLKSGSLTGRVNITLTLENKRDNIILNSDSLNISEIVFAPFNEWNKQLPIKNYTVDNNLERLIINFNNSISQGKYFLTVYYHGNTKNKTRGIYLSYYKNKHKERRPMATSKFEPTYARQAFPCFDEPQMKAIYTVHLLKPKDDKYIALSNMPQSHQEDVNDGVLVHFEPSAKMSTYLACFIVSDFEAREGSFEISTGESIPLKVFATPEQMDKTVYAAEVGKKVIEFFNTYFDIDYPLPKLDMAAIPDFVSGAMEHWGLVTYRETALLYDPKISSTANKQRVATVIAHELAHSWFGNLVTMKWWNDLWLNEGFASYIEYKGVQAVETDWKMMDQFLIEDLHSVLKIDSVLSSHPIVQTVLTPDEITSIFDTISYSKGASILRMLEDAVTEEVFKKGVTNYLRKYEYGNAVTDDLWNELASLFDEVKIKDFMDTWTIQMGYPVLNVKTEGANYVLTQTRYLTDQNAVDTKKSPYDYKWIIPITYVTDTGRGETLSWFFNDQEQVTISKPTNAKWLKFNHKQVGYYRVNYEESHWNELIANIESMDSVDKTHLIEETFRLAGSGHIKYNIPLELSKYMANEREYVPWSAFNTVISEVMRFLQNSEVYTTLRAYVSNLVQPSYEYYTFDEKPSDGHLDKRARATVLNLGCSAGIKECNDKAAEVFKNWLDGQNEEISLDLSQMIYIYGMRNSPVEYWDKLFAKFAAETDAGEKLRLLYGLASIKDTSYLTKLIELASKDETYVRSQDYFTCLIYISYNTIGTSLVWDYVREHWPDLVERFTLNDRNLGNMIPSITQLFTTQTKLEEMEAFFAKYPDAGAGATARLRALETVRNNIKWLAQYKDTVEDWIQNQ